MASLSWSVSFREGNYTGVYFHNFRGIDPYYNSGRFSSTATRYEPVCKNCTCRALLGILYYPYGDTYNSSKRFKGSVFQNRYPIYYSFYEGSDNGHILWEVNPPSGYTGGPIYILTEDYGNNINGPATGTWTSIIPDTVINAYNSLSSLPVPSLSSSNKSSVSTTKTRAQEYWDIISTYTDFANYTQAREKYNAIISNSNIIEQREDRLLNLANKQSLTLARNNLRFNYSNLYTQGVKDYELIKLFIKE